MLVIFYVADLNCFWCVHCGVFFSNVFSLCCLNVSSLMSLLELSETLIVLLCLVLWFFPVRMCERMMEVLYFGTIRMNILMLDLDTRNVEQTTDVRMYKWRLYFTRDSGYIAAHVGSWKLNDYIGKYTAFYTNAWIEENLWDNSQMYNWHNEMNRITWVRKCHMSELMCEVSFHCLPHI